MSNQLHDTAQRTRCIIDSARFKLGNDTAFHKRLDELILQRADLTRTAESSAPVGRSGGKPYAVDSFDRMLPGTRAPNNRSPPFATQPLDSQINYFRKTAFAKLAGFGRVEWSVTKIREGKRITFKRTKPAVNHTIPTCVLTDPNSIETYSQVFVNAINDLHRQPDFYGPWPINDVFPFMQWARNIALTAILADETKKGAIDLSRADFSLTTNARSSVTVVRSGQLQLGIHLGNLTGNSQEMAQWSRYPKDFHSKSARPPLPAAGLVDPPSRLITAHYDFSKPNAQVQLDNGIAWLEYIALEVGRRIGRDWTMKMIQAELAKTAARSGAIKADVNIQKNLHPALVPFAIMSQFDIARSGSKLMVNEEFFGIARGETYKGERSKNPVRLKAPFDFPPALAEDEALRILTDMNMDALATDDIKAALINGAIEIDFVSGLCTGSLSRRSRPFFCEHMDFAGEHDCTRCSRPIPCHAVPAVGDYLCWSCAGDVDASSVIGDWDYIPPHCKPELAIQGSIVRLIKYRKEILARDKDRELTNVREQKAQEIHERGAILAKARPMLDHISGLDILGFYHSHPHNPILRAVAVPRNRFFIDPKASGIYLLHSEIISPSMLGYSLLRGTHPLLAARILSECAGLYHVYGRQLDLDTASSDAKAAGTRVKELEALAKRLDKLCHEVPHVTSSLVKEEPRKLLKIQAEVNELERVVRKLAI